MKFKEIRNKYFPFISKIYLFRILNPILNQSLPFGLVRSLVRQSLKKIPLTYLNLGGYSPTENYFALHLSPVAPYGIPVNHYFTVSLKYDEASGEIEQNVRDLSAPATSLHYNIINGLPLESVSFSGINMSHILEHFTRDDALKVLKECYRVLKPNGVLRISCPDLLRYAKAYVNRDASFFDSLPIQKACLYENLTTYGDRFISKAYDNDLAYGHKWFYDAESTIELVKLAGFTKVEERCLHDSLLPNIAEVEPAYRVFESFYIEATK